MYSTTNLTKAHLRAESPTQERLRLHPRHPQCRQFAGKNDITAGRFRTSLALAGGTVLLDAELADIDAESGLLPLRAAAERKAENESPLVRTPVGAA
jgi:hypothetical protein